MNLIGIDCGVHCGWASCNGGHVESGVQVFDTKRGESPGMRFLRFRRFLSELCALVQPALLVYEQAHHRGGAATELLVGMTTRVQETAAELGIEHQGVHSGTLKKWATGRGDASKADMVAAARERCAVDVGDDNEADALLLMAWAREQFTAGPPAAPMAATFDESTERGH